MCGKIPKSRVGIELPPDRQPVEAIAAKNNARDGQLTSVTIEGEECTVVVEKGCDLGSVADSTEIASGRVAETGEVGSNDRSGSFV